MTTRTVAHLVLLALSLAGAVAMAVAVIMLGFVLAARVAVGPTLTADEVEASLASSGLPVSGVQAHTPGDDPNQLLGRPGQYVGKVVWIDTRTTTREAATIEVFENRGDLESRRRYLESFTRSAPFAQYMDAHPTRPALMRLPAEITPEQADRYREWFARL